MNPGSLAGSLFLALAALAMLAASVCVADEPTQSRSTGYPLVPGTSVIGAPGRHVTSGEKSLFRIAREHGLGYQELAAANPGLDPWMPEAGRELMLPTVHILPDAPREGIVINLAERRLYYFPEGEEQVLTWPVSIGREGHDTPLGRTEIVARRKDPVWVPPPSVREKHEDLPVAIAPGPANPLGTRALNLGWQHYVIHGTNLAFTIGERASHGCLRLYNRDVEELFELVEEGTPVQVVHQPVRLGWRGGVLYAAFSPEWSALDEQGNPANDAYPERTGAIERIISVAGDRAGELDWDAVGHALENPRGGIFRLLPASRDRLREEPVTAEEALYL